MTNSLAAHLPPPRKIPARLSATLDLIRWFAAAMVVVNHLRGLVFVDYRLMQASGWWFRGLFFLSGFGHQAVIVFFVLSGYLVGGEVLQSLQRGDFQARSYAVKRLARLYAVYLAALLLGGGFDWIGVNHFNQTGLYTHGIDFPALEYSAAARLNAPTLMANMAFCQRLLAEPFGSNEPLWSLANEAWYYVMFPLFAVALLGSRGRSRLICLVLALAAAWFVHGPLLAYFSIWLLGLVPRLLPRRLIKWPSIPALLMAGLLVATRFWWFERLDMLQLDLLLAVAFVLFINSCDHGAVTSPPPLAGFHRAMAGFSYSVYLLHWPFALLLVAILQATKGLGLRMNTFDWRSIGCFAGLFLLIYLYAWVIAGVTERRTAGLRRWLARWLGVRENSPHAYPAHR